MFDLKLNLQALYEVARIMSAGFLFTLGAIAALSLFGVI